MSLSFVVILTADPAGGYVVAVPALPEVCTQGETEDEALTHAHEVIELAIEHRIAEGEPVPDGAAAQLRHVIVELPSVA